MKKPYILIITLIMLLAFSSVTFAESLSEENLGSLIDVTLSQPTQVEIEEAKLNNFKNMKVLTDNGEQSGNLTGLYWINQSTYAAQQKTTKYKTMAISFKIGDYYGLLSNESYYTPGKPEEERIDKISITRNALVESFAKNSGDSEERRKLINEAIDTEAYLYVGAWIVIYNDKNGNGDVDAGERLDVITKEDQIDSKASIFPATNRADMHTRFQQIKINGNKIPDFYPTPEVSEQWKAEFIDPAVCAKTYSYKADQTSITFPVTLKNVGEKGGTDFKAVWYGSSAVDPGTWSHPVWQADTQTVLNKGEFKTFNVTVNLPVPDYANGILVFKCNVDGKTPASELNQTNSSMFIKIQPEGVDIAAVLPDEPTVYLINPGETANVYVSLLAKRIDSGTTPVNVDVNYSGPFGSVNKQTSLEGYSMGENITGYEIRFKLSKPGTYTINASAWPIGMTDTNPNNNTDQTTVIVKLKDQNDAHKVNPDDQTRVNLRS